MNRFRLFLEKLQNIAFIRAVRNGLVMMIPIIMTGSFALILRELPIPVYQTFIRAFANGLLYDLFNLGYNATFGMLSAYMAASIGFCMAKEGKYAKTGIIIGAPMVALAAFLMSVGYLTGNFQQSSLSAVGMFTAIVCGASSSAFYMFISGFFSHIRLFSDGSDPAFNRSLRAIVPAGMVIALFALFNAAVTVIFDVDSFWALVVRAFNRLFDIIGDNFMGGFAYILLSSVFWFFGIHGSDMLESVNQGIFLPASRANEAVAAAGGTPEILYTKTFFDVFVLIGGCGTLLALLIAVILFSQRRANRSLGGMAAFPMLFNINELMVFGLPIIYNPVMLIPFICAPLASFLISSAAMATGIVPLTCHEVAWTTPIILGGYQATGSVAGAILQVVNVAVCVFIYAPFVRMYDRTKAEEALRNIGTLVKILTESEKRNEHPVLTEFDGVTGDIAKQLVSDLQTAMIRRELYLDYQPQFDQKGNMIGAEALLRWRHPTFGKVYPPLVIRIAEESGKLTALETYIFRRVREDMTALGKEINISVNATAPSMRDPSFTDFLIREFPGAMAGLAHICIEITEQSDLATDARIAGIFTKLKEHGFQLAIDDFSMGFTSLKYLSENRFDVVKLDGSLVRGLENPRNRDIIASIVYLSTSLHFSVLAEFVETANQRDMLANIGCTHYQGYLYSPAVPYPRLAAFIDGGAAAIQTSDAMTART